MSKNSGDENARPLALFVRRWVPLLICAVAWPGSLWAQGAADNPATTSKSTSQNQDGGGPLGFSIESEMLTYRALESNSEAVACDIAAYLRGGSASFNNSTVGSVCTVSGGANNKASIVILPFDQTQFNDFPYVARGHANHERVADACLGRLSGNPANQGSGERSRCLGCGRDTRWISAFGGANRFRACVV